MYILFLNVDDIWIVHNVRYHLTMRLRNCEMLKKNLVQSNTYAGSSRTSQCGQFYITARQLNWFQTNKPKFLQPLPQQQLGLDEK